MKLKVPSEKHKIDLKYGYSQTKKCQYNFFIRYYSIGGRGFMDEWKNKIEKKLRDFYLELELCKKKNNHDYDIVGVLFATKYLNSDQLIRFLKIYKDLRNEKVTIGENRVQDAEVKFRDLQAKRPGLKKVFIGNLQKNKINRALLIFDEIWGVDSLELAEEINKRVVLKKLPIFLEVNISGEESKYGISEAKAEEIIKIIKKLSKLELKGLMTMAPETDNREEIRSVFRKLRQLADKYKLLASMGMSGDFQEAVEEGSDILRIGSRIFE